MMEHDPTLGRMRGFRAIGFSEKVKRCLDRAKSLNLRLESRSFEACRPHIDAARREIALASDITIVRLMEKNPDILRLVRAGTNEDVKGLFAYLPLNNAGMAALVDGSFDGLNPDANWIAEAGVRPEAIYLWLVYLPGALAQAIGVVAQAFDDLVPESCPVFSRAVNAHADRLNLSMGFLDAKQFYPDCRPGLLVVFPEKELVKPPTPALSVKLARSFEDMFQVLSVRSATYLAEQFCYYAEEFDGNDFCATHFMGSVDGDPAGCIRIRFFADFAKIERLAVRAEYRNSKLAFQLVRAAIRHCQLKGYTKLYGHSRLDLVRFWRVFGFQPRTDRPQFSFANIEYRELYLDTARHPQAIGLAADPMVIIRPEGDWDRPGPLDLSLSEQDPRRRDMMIAKTRTLAGVKIAKHDAQI